MNKIIFAISVMSLFSLGCIDNVHSIGDSVKTSDDVMITVSNVETFDYIIKEESSNKFIIDEEDKIYPAHGSKFVLFKVQFENVGRYKIPYGWIYGMPIISKDKYDLITILDGDVKYNMGGNSGYVVDKWGYETKTPSYLFIVYGIPEHYNPLFYQFGDVYPGVKEEGWCIMTVPYNMKLDKSYICIKDIKWKMA